MNLIKCAIIQQIAAHYAITSISGLACQKYGSPRNMALDADWAEHARDHFQRRWRMSQVLSIQVNGTCTHPTKKRLWPHRNSKSKEDAEPNLGKPMVWQLSCRASLHHWFVHICLSLFCGCGCQCTALTLHFFSLKYGELTIPFQSCLCKTSISPLWNYSSQKSSSCSMCAITPCNS